MEKGKCFILKESSKEEPIYVYLINEIREENLSAYRIRVSKNGVDAWDFPEEYDEVIPDDAIYSPEETYQKVKDRINEFVDKVSLYIQEHIVKEDFKLEVGKRYYDGFIYTVTEIGESDVYYDLFRLDPEFISPTCSGIAMIDGIEKHWYPISDEIYQEVMNRYKTFVANLQDFLFYLG